MGFIYDIIKELFPSLRDAAKGAVTGFRRAKRKRQHIFILKAITRPRIDHGLSMRTPEGWRYDLSTIERKIYIAQVQAAINIHRDEDVALMLSPEEQEEFREELKAIQKKYGLPAINDPKRAEKIEDILHDMVDIKLRFHPPNSWSIL